MGSNVPRVVCVCLVVLAMPWRVWAEPASGNSSRTEAETERIQPAEPDFLFGKPRLTIGLRGLSVNPLADSDILSFITKQLTLEKKDFRAKGFAFDLGLPVSSRLNAPP